MVPGPAGAGGRSRDSRVPRGFLSWGGGAGRGGSSLARGHRGALGTPSAPSVSFEESRGVGHLWKRLPRGAGANTHRLPFASSHRAARCGSARCTRSSSARSPSWVSGSRRVRPAAPLSARPVGLRARVLPESQHSPSGKAMWRGSSRREAGRRPGRPCVAARRRRRPSSVSMPGTWRLGSSSRPAWGCSRPRKHPTRATSARPGWGNPWGPPRLQQWPQPGRPRPDLRGQGPGGV